MSYKELLSHKQLSFIAALLRLGSIESACKETGISRTTYYRWMESSAFRKEAEVAKYYVYNTSMKQIKSLFERTLSCYEDLLASENEALRLRAMNWGMKNAAAFIKLREHADKCDEWLKLQADMTKKEASR